VRARRLAEAAAGVNDLLLGASNALAAAAAAARDDEAGPGPGALVARFEAEVRGGGVAG
jgi:hypothetical protein